MILFNNISLTNFASQYQHILVLPSYLKMIRIIICIIHVINYLFTTWPDVLQWVVIPSKNTKYKRVKHITIRRLYQKPLSASQANTMAVLGETVNDRFSQPFQTVTYLYILLLISEIICCSGKYNRGHRRNGQRPIEEAFQCFVFFAVCRLLTARFPFCMNTISFVDNKYHHCVYTTQKTIF